MTDHEKELAGFYKRLRKNRRYLPTFAELTLSDKITLATFMAQIRQIENNAVSTMMRFRKETEDA